MKRATPRTGASSGDVPRPSPLCGRRPVGVGKRRRTHRRRSEPFPLLADGGDDRGLQRRRVELSPKRCTRTGIRCSEFGQRPDLEQSRANPRWPGGGNARRRIGACTPERAFSPAIARVFRGPEAFPPKLGREVSSARGRSSVGRQAKISGRGLKFGGSKSARGGVGGSCARLVVQVWRTAPFFFPARRAGLAQRPRLFSGSPCRFGAATPSFFGLDVQVWRTSPSSHRSGSRENWGRGVSGAIRGRGFHGLGRFARRPPRQKQGPGLAEACRFGGSEGPRASRKRFDAAPTKGTAPFFRRAPRSESP